MCTCSKVRTGTVGPSFYSMMSYAMLYWLVGDPSYRIATLARYTRSFSRSLLYRYCTYISVCKYKSGLYNLLVYFIGTLTVMLGHKLICIHIKAMLQQSCSVCQSRCAKSSDCVMSRLQAVTTGVIGDKRVMWKETRIDECECQVQCDAALNESSALARPHTPGSQPLARKPSCRSPGSSRM